MSWRLPTVLNSALADIQSSAIQSMRAAGQWFWRIAGD
jgi:hypothetical protein